jgi:hypothetical protein
MQTLSLWNDYTREDVHAIFSPETHFTPRAGTWGLQGIVRIPARERDWVFFVTFGQEQGDHIFDESITDGGVLSWQSQSAQRLADDKIQEFIHHDDKVNNIHLFLRTKVGKSYSYLGKIGYLRHDLLREKPTHFQWQLLEWPAPPEFLNRIGLVLLRSKQEIFEQPSLLTHGLTITTPPPPKPLRKGVLTAEFRNKKIPNYALQDANNRALGLDGELLVVEHEKAFLIAAGRADLAARVVHVSVVEGDGAGYDIRSFDPNGDVRYIEVKTTRGDAYTSFFISPNELAFSTINCNTFFLYRLYDFDKKSNSAKTYLLEGNISSQLNLYPTAYKAELNSVFNE